MIIDSIKNIGRYRIPLADDIVKFLSMADTNDLLAPEIEVRGRELFVRPLQYRTKAPEEGKFEAHRVYMDLQYIVDGAEIIETAPEDLLYPLTVYDGSGDYQFFAVENGISRILVRAGEFAIFYPGEAHRPCCFVDNGVCDVRKLVFKIRISG